MAAHKELAQYGVVPNTRHTGSLEIALRCWIRAMRLVKFELRSKHDMPWAQRRQAWRAGFCSDTWEMYGLDSETPKHPPQDYLNDWQAGYRQYRINGFSNPIIGNKLVLSGLLKSLGTPHPRVISQLLDGRLVEPGKGSGEALARVLERTLDAYPRQVFRPTWAGNGHGVFFVSQHDGKLTLNHEEIAFDELCSLLSQMDRYLVTEFQQQADYAREIFPGTTNTIRMMSLWDYEQGEPFIAAAAHRFGTSRSGVLDNFNGGEGGTSASVDLEHHRLGPAVLRDQAGNICWQARHPDTDALIEGVVIPGLEETLNGVLDAARAFPWCPMIGWDVVLTQDSWAVIEANSLPSTILTQTHTPLMKNPRSRAFFEHHGLKAVRG